MQVESKKILNPEKWLNDHGDFLYNFALSRMFSREQAEDLIQETFLAAFKSVDKFQGQSSERTWLVSILKRKIVDYYRKKSRSKEQLSDADSPFIRDKFMYGRWKEEHEPQAWDFSDTNLTDNAEFIDILKKCISYLPDKWKSVFSLKHIEEAPNSEICEDLNISESNIWVILHRSRLQLRQCVEKLWYKN